MIREVVVNGRSERIEIEGNRVRYANLEGSFTIEPMDAGRFTVTLNNRSFQVAPGAAGEISVNGRILQMEIFDPRDLRTGRAASANQGRQEISAPMPGKVVRLLVAKDDSVEEGQGLVVVEAMKMQNEMKSPKAGKVVEVRTRAEATVNYGEVLVVIE